MKHGKQQQILTEYNNMKHGKQQQILGLLLAWSCNQTKA